VGLSHRPSPLGVALNTATQTCLPSDAEPAKTLTRPVLGAVRLLEPLRLTYYDPCGGVVLPGRAVTPGPRTESKQHVGARV